MVNVEKILALFVKAQEDFVLLQSLGKRFLILFTMKVIENELSKENFVRVHRTYFVNLDYIQQILGNRIVIKVNEENMHIPIGKSYKDILYNRLNLMN